MEALVQFPDLRPLLCLHVVDGGAVCWFAIPTTAEAIVCGVPALIRRDFAGLRDRAEVVEWCEGLASGLFCSLAQEAGDEDGGLVQRWSGVGEDEIDSLVGCEGKILHGLRNLDELVGREEEVVDVCGSVISRCWLGADCHGGDDAEVWTRATHRPEEFWVGGLGYRHDLTTGKYDAERDDVVHTEADFAHDVSCRLVSYSHSELLLCIHVP